MSEKFYITTSIAYTNAPVHIGFALELIQADVLARYNRLLGKETYYLTGTDEHGTKIAKAAKLAKKSEREFVDEISNGFRKIAKGLNISNDDFIRTSDQERHWPTAIKIWNQLKEKGDIYKKKYRGLYCVGHESFVKKSDLENGICPLHKTKPEEVEEENYFFKLTKYAREIKKVVEKDQLLIVPIIRKREILNIIDDAEDISISRPSEILKWGIPVPGDASQTYWVWIDALSNYISALDYASNGEKFKKYWPADVHLVGKDILRFHALIWTAILLAVGVELPRAIYVHGFINVDGQKMSKTIGNVIDPFKVVEKYGVDPVRYFLLREIPSGEDGDFSEEKLEQRYQADLANGLGNLVQRVLTLVENNLGGELNYLKRFEKPEVKEFIKNTEEKYRKNIEEFKLHEALANVFELVGFANAYTNEHRPWELAAPVPTLHWPSGTKGQLDGAAGAKATSGLGRPDHFLEVMINLTLAIATTAFWIYPFLPETGENVLAAFGLTLKDKIESLDHKKLIIKKGEVLFPRLN